MGYSNCNPCDPCGTNQNAAKAAAYARQANTYAANAENSWLEFNALYLGAFAVAPTVDNEGNPLQVGALYWNSSSNQLFSWSGTVWILSTGFNEFTPFLATGTPTARNLVTRERDWINVKDFGAVGNGVADDTVAINNAIGAGFRTVYFPAGTYLISDTITITGGDTILAGDGPRTSINLNDPVKDIIHIRPPVGSTSELLRCGVYDMILFNVNTSTGTLANPRTGAGLRLTRGGWCNFNNVLIRNCPDGLVCEGGQCNIFEQFHLWPIASGLTLRPQSSLITFKGFFQGGEYFHCNNTQLTNFTATTGGPFSSYEHCIKVQSSDGLLISSGNVAHATKSQVLLYVDSPAGVTTGLTPYISALKFSNLYFDSSINTIGSEYNFYVPQNIVGSHRRIYSVTIDNVIIANSQKNSFYAEEPIYDLVINACDIQGNRESAIVLTNATNLPGRSNFAKTVISNNAFAFNNSSDDPTKSEIDFGYQEAISIIGNNFGGITQCGIRARDTNNVITITGNVLSNSVNPTYSDFVKEGGFFTFSPYVVSGNSSDSTTLSNSLNGLRVGNKRVSDLSTLDWYEEQTLTPQLLIGADATGITQGGSTGGFATRNGNFVNFTLRVVLTSKGVNTGNVSITGLPYTTDNLGRTACAVSISGIDSAITQQIMAELVYDGTTLQRDIFLFKQVGGSRVALTDADIRNFTDISIAGTYRV